MERSAQRCATSSASTGRRCRCSGRTIDVLERGLRRTGDSLKRAAGPLRRIPVEYRVGLIVGVVLIGGFFAAVVPLITGGGGTPAAEVNPILPHNVVLGQQATVPVALDNTGEPIIPSVCIRVTVDPAGTVDFVSASFAGLETVPFTGDHVCGGSLSGGEVISVRVLMQGARTGSARVTMVPSDGKRDIGPARSAIVGVTAPGP